MTTETKRFSLRRKTQEIILELENGTEQKYLLKEFTGEGRVLYYRRMFELGKTDVDVKLPLDKLVLTSFTVVGLHLHQEGQDEPVGEEFVAKNIPSATIDELFDLCKDLSGLRTKEGLEEAKNS